MKKTAAVKILRQGDVLLVAAALPAGAIQQKPDQNKIVLALGEATGHHHRVENVVIDGHESARIFSFGAERFLQTMETVALQHEEHAPVEIPAGTYQVVIQQEYTPDALRNVAD